MRVLVTGATGLVGTAVVQKLIEAGDEVVVLTRNINRAALVLGGQCRYFQWSDHSNPPPKEAFEGVEGIVNLMGESIAERWDEDQKKKIYESRVYGTRHLVETIGSLTRKPRVFVSTSAVGIYGDRGGEEITENSSLGNDFLATLCKDWENEAQKIKNHGARVVIIRTGIVLGQGGALKKMLPVFKLGLGGPLGKGDQYMSWIHVDDLANMYVWALKKSALEGVYNGTAQYPATNAEFSKVLARVLHRPCFAKAPAFALKLILGEMSGMLLEGQKVLPAKFKDQNFRYRYPTLEIALKESIF